VSQFLLNPLPSSTYTLLAALFFLSQLLGLDLGVISGQSIGASVELWGMVALCMMMMMMMQEWVFRNVFACKGWATCMRAGEAQQQRWGCGIGVSAILGPCVCRQA
jgi:galactitol-specific phosphotransferase system IIC component